MGKVQDNNTITHNVKKQRFVRNIHESCRWRSSTASGNGDSVCACSQNCYSAKAERIPQLANLYRADIGQELNIGYIFQYRPVVTDIGPTSKRIVKCGRSDIGLISFLYRADIVTDIGLISILVAKLERPEIGPL